MDTTLSNYEPEGRGNDVAMSVYWFSTARPAESFWFSHTPGPWEPPFPAPHFLKYCHLDDISETSRVFLSYARKDEQDAAPRLKDDLEATGFHVCQDV